MLLTELIIHNFINSINRDDIHKIEKMSNKKALSHLFSLYEESYGAKPSGAALDMLKLSLRSGSERGSVVQPHIISKRNLNDLIF